jgi:hypothetical protein
MAETLGPGPILNLVRLDTGAYHVSITNPDESGGCTVSQQNIIKLLTAGLSAEDRRALAQGLPI